MERVLDPPMIPQPRGVEPRARLLAADEVAGLTRRRPGDRSLAVTHADDGQARPVLAVTNRRRRVQDRVAPVLVPAVAARAVLVDIMFDAGAVVVQSLLEARLNVLQEVRLVVLDGERVVAAA